MKPRAMFGSMMVLMAAVLWGTTGTAQSLGPAGLSAYWVGAWRLGVAALFFAVFVLATRGAARGRGDLLGLHWGLVLLAGTSMAAYNLSFFAGVKATGVAVGTAVAIGSGPVWAGLLQQLAGGPRPGAPWWVGTLAAIAGGGLLVLGSSAKTVDATGVVLCLMAGLGYAAYALINKRLVATSAPASVTLAVFGVAAVMALPLAAVIAGPFVASPAGWALVLYLGIVTTGVSYLLFSAALRHISGATGVTLALGEPLTAFVLALVVVGERPGALAFIGLAFVMLGLAVVVWSEARGGRVPATAGGQGDHLP
jgi:DME family drug/metabolite transporter